MRVYSSLQVLTPLSGADLLWLAALPGISEELLFRGALIPALSPDWCANCCTAICRHRDDQASLLPVLEPSLDHPDLSLLMPFSVVLFTVSCTKSCRRGVLAAGAVFGLLHNSGGRNLAFAGWAAVVGSVYGAVYLQTGDIGVPMGAHVLANLAGAVLWLSAQKKAGRERRVN